MTTRQTPELATKILRCDAASPKFDNRFHYRGTTGRLKLLKKSPYPDISYTTHKCERFPDDTRALHGASVKTLVKYIEVTKNDRLILDPKNTHSLKVYADSDFSRNGHNPTAMEYVIMTK